MRRLLLLSLATAFINTPVLADATQYLVQQPIDSNATGLTDKQPVPNTNCAPGSRWCVWAPVGNDLILSHYQCSVSNTQVYAPPAAAPAAASTVTVVNGTSGSLTWTWGGMNGAKRLVLVLNNFIAPSVQGVTVTFPAVLTFSAAPAITANTTGLSITTITTTTVKIPSAPAASGTIILEGI